MLKSTTKSKVVSVNPAALLRFVGVDTSKDTLDAADTAGRTHSVANDAAGIRSLVEWVLRTPTALVVVEATGRLQRKFVAALHEAGVLVAVVNPRKVRSFATASGVLAKTDRIDAKMLADFAARMKPEPTPRPSAAQLVLEDLVTARLALVKEKVTLGALLRELQGPDALKALKGALHAVVRQIEKLDQALVDHVDSDKELKRKAELLDSVPGVGKVLAAGLLAELPELGTLDRRRIASLAGLAPIAHESGKFKAKRCIGGGREGARSMLYMAALTARKGDPVLEAHSERLLLKNGSRKKLVVIAVARHLLTILNAVLRSGKSWEVRPVPATCAAV